MKAQMGVQTFLFSHTASSRTFLPNSLLSRRDTPHRACYNVSLSLCKPGHVDMISSDLDLPLASFGMTDYIYILSSRYCSLQPPHCQYFITSVFLSHLFAKYALVLSIIRPTTTGECHGSRLAVYSLCLQQTYQLIRLEWHFFLDFMGSVKKIDDAMGRLVKYGHSQHRSPDRHVTENEAARKGLVKAIIRPFGHVGSW